MVKIYGNVIISPPQEVNLKQDDANVGNKKKIVYVDISSSTTVAAGASETIMIQPPEGKIWRLKGIFCDVNPPDGATAGTHSLDMYYSKVGLTHLVVTQNYNKALLLRIAPRSYSSISPSDSAVFTTLVLNTVISNSTTLIIRYKNNTDAEQTNIRLLKLILEEEDEATS